MLRRITITAALVVLSVMSAHSPAPLAAQSMSPTRLAAIDSMAGAEFARDSIASLTIGVVTPDGLVWTRSYGFADMATRRLANRQSVYRIGSVTKTFTAAMALQLVDAGKIRLSDPVERYYPEIRELPGYAKLTAPITIAQLATMTSGLAREPKQEGPFWTGPAAQWDSTVHLALAHTPIEQPPGARFSYSNIGYAILGAALGRAAGMPYMRWQEERVFRPLGMQHTAFEAGPAVSGQLTRGYDVAQSGRYDSQQADREAITGRGYKVPNGALFTTVDDLGRFLVAVMGHGSPPLVSRTRLDSAYAVTSAGLGVNGSVYGLGFSAERRNGLTWFGHNGGVAGYAAEMYFDGDRTVGVIVLRNALGGQVRTGRLAIEALRYLVATKQ